MISHVLASNGDVAFRIRCICRSSVFGF